MTGSTTLPPPGQPAPPGVTASACGKVILLGEHAVVYQVPALCGALERGAAVQAVAGDGRLHVPAWAISTPPAAELTAAGVACELSPLAAAYRAILESLGTVRPLSFSTLGHDFIASFTIPTGAGLGSSAALAVALVRALDMTLRLELDAQQVDAAALAAEKVFHGHPSGLDHTVAQQGGFGLFRRGHGLTPLGGLTCGALPLIIGHTGRARDTKGRVARVAELHSQQPAATAARFKQIGALVDQAVAALRRGDLPALGAAMNENQVELAALDVSCPEIEQMCSLARSAGALGAKLTGGGGGGCVVALAPGREPDIAAVWEQAGFSSFLARIGTQ
jgi:mevalonate kinase